MSRQQIVSFGDYFRAVTGHDPFLWQSEVAERLCRNDWYDAVGLPPATGKTCFLSIWYYALYRNVYDISISGGVRAIPCRLWYVVDRKVIVDGASEDAKKLRDRLLSEPQLFPVGEMVKNHFGCDLPLVAEKIRGGMDRDDRNRWLTTPNQPTIVVSTVDQYGSRLLFRGYGISPKVRSIHAAMTGMDSLVVVDESHLAKSLLSVLKVATGDFRQQMFRIPPTRVVELTATGGNQNKFPLDQAVANDQALAPRLNVHRPVSFVRVSKGTMVDALVAEAQRLAKKHNIVGVICNTVNIARHVLAKLKKLDSVMLIGRIRAHEREILLGKDPQSYRDRLIATRDRSRDKPLVVVATQTIEVGADFDFDALVSQAAPLDCLIQRFGRLNRTGQYANNSEGVIVYKEGEKDWVYGPVTQATFDWLKTTYQAGVDFSKVENNPTYYAKPNHIAHLSKELLEVLAHTHPVPAINLDGLLHGVKTRSDSDFEIIYRSEITDKVMKDPVEVTKWLALNHRPHNEEILSLPIYCLFEGDSTDDSYTSPLPPEEEEKLETQGRQSPEKDSLLERRCVRYRDGKVIKMKEIVPGDLVIVPVTHGQYDQYGWNPDSDAPVKDVSDYYTRTIVRLHQDMDCPGFNLDKYKDLVDETVDVPALVEDLKKILIPQWEENPDLADKVAIIKKNLTKLKRSRIRMTPDKLGVYCYLPRKKNEDQKQQKLNAHNEKVGKNAKHFAEKISLGHDLVETLGLSGECHDLGKGDPRFQETLYYPEPPNPAELLAKSQKGYNPNAPKEYPHLWRHELQSLVTVLENNLGLALADREVFYHLVASHHGWFRNYIPPSEDKTFEPFRVNGYTSSRQYFDVYPELDRNAFYRLNEKYGFWGLAFLETILRLADWKN